ncbi:tyrosine--tRNA ligase, cytoplasmic isoform X1 [Bombina bombina]|uniref:tyrosine--tRNA ligase, cytoplasmic isoform X1 n=1 Tax=Bombina bombina TaxID=8345 RepID=UPI00235ACAC3|nr:tyrosine--tRNA ligase, cytoplasmic isoform X1 [Bombina bombina]
MDELYRDADIQLTAEQKMRSLKQGKKTVEDYITEFKLYASDSAWSSVSLRNQFRLGLSDSVKDELARIEMPSTLEALMKLATQIDRRLRERKAERSYSETTSKPSSSTYSHQRPITTEQATPMEIGVIRGPLTADERMRRKTNHLCMYCGNSNHMVTDCPILRKNKKSKFLTINNTSHVEKTLSYCNLSLTLQWDLRRLTTNAIVDSGAFGNFIDISTVQKNKIPTVLKKTPVSLKVIDGSDLKYGPITHNTIPILVTIDGAHTEYLTFDIIPSPHFQVVLGLYWLQLHNPSINWSSFSVNFTSPYCESTCYPQPVILQATTEEVKIPEPYQDFVEVFSKSEAESLPPHRVYDCPIELIPGATLPVGHLYPLSQPELDHLKQYLQDNLRKGFIRPSSSPAAAGMFFVTNKDSTLRPIIDYRELNKRTVKNRYPLPLIPELIERLTNASIFTKLDLRGAYNLIRIREGDEWLTAFRTRYGLYEYLVMPFGLCNAPATFQHFINDIFRDLLDVCLVVYLDDILIYSNNISDHIKHVRWVLARLKIHKLYAKLEKCSFHNTSISFLGYTISSAGIQMQSEKVEAVKHWPQPTDRKSLQRFLGFANYYRKFIKNFSTVVKPLTQLTGTTHPFLWEEKHTHVFENLKRLFTEAPILMLPNVELQYILEVDSSDYAIGAVLSQQKAPNEPMHPISFFSKTMTSAERNYAIGDKELLAIRRSLEFWRHLLEGAKKTFIIYTDHKNLQYLQNNKTLSARQVRWSLYFARFDFQIIYRPACKNGKADALSRQLSIPPTFSKPSNIIPTERFIGLTSDFISDVKKFSNTPPPDSKFDLIIKDGIYYYKDRIYLPEPLRLEIIKEHHDTPLSGHPGETRTLQLLTRLYWWPNMKRSISEYIKGCITCQTCKTEKKTPYGLLMPIPVSDRPWKQIGIDFIVDLPPSKTHTTIMVVVDSFSKMAHFIPFHKLPSSAETATLFIEQIVRLHGVPSIVISDRGSQFTSRFWKSLCLSLGIKHQYTTSFHPQANGQVERINQWLDEYLRCFCSYQQHNWITFLPFAEFAYNNLTNSSTKLTPFFANYGYHPSFTQVSSTPSDSPLVDEFNNSLQDNFNFIKDNIIKAQNSQKYYYDLRRREPPRYQIGDQVWLSTKNLRIQVPSRKLTQKYCGPFTIVKVVNQNAVTLKLPPCMKIHATFHVSLLKPYTPTRSKAPILPSSLSMQDSDVYEVKELLDSRYSRGMLQYLVRWKNYSEEEDNWEPASNIYAPRLVAQFHRRFPDRPRPQAEDQLA